MDFNYDKIFPVAEEIVEIFQKEMDYLYNCFVQSADEDAEEDNFEKDFWDYYGDDLDLLLDDLSCELSPFKGYFNCGAEKIVFIPKDYNFVIKFIIGDGINSEPAIYQKARAKGLEDYFLPCYRGGRVEIVGSPIFWTIQQKYEPTKEDRTIFYDIQDGECKVSKKKIKSFKNSANYALMTAAAVFGLADSPKFFNFLWKNSINDLHNENWGIMNKKIKLFDYAGF